MATGEIKALYFSDGVTVTEGVSAPQGYATSVTFSGAETSKAVDVSAFTSAAEDFIWVLKNPSSKQILADITGSGSTVTISTDEIALPAGTYTLIGV